MRGRATGIWRLLGGDRDIGRAVPPTGFTARLTLLTAAAMAFLAVFALALSLASGRLAERWGTALAGSATVRVSAPEDQEGPQVDAALRILAQTPGVLAARALTEAEDQALLEPWFGPDLPLDALPIPRLIDVTLGDGFDAEGLRLRLRGEVPGATLDDHARWRAPLAEAAGRLRLLGMVATGLIALATAAMITLAAQAALAANAQVIRVMRQAGARDATIARAFVRRFTARAAGGALAGALLGTLAVALLPAAEEPGGFLAGLSFQGASWLVPLLVPPFAALVAFAATRAAAFATLRRTP